MSLTSGRSFSRLATFESFVHCTDMHPAEKQEILDTDWKLYLAAKTDRRQFSEIFRMYYPRIFGYALRRTGGVDAAAEIASATFEKAFHGFARFEWREIRLSSWLYRIATNEMNAHYRKRRFRLEIRIVDAADEAAMTACLADDREALEHELLLHEQYRWLRSAIDRLPLRLQAALSLRYLEQKSLAEIGEILQRPEGTMKSLISRGTKRLREAWRQHSSEPEAANRAKR